MEQMNQMGTIPCIFSLILSFSRLVCDRSPVKSKEPEHSHAKSHSDQQQARARRTLYEEYLRENNLKDDEASEKQKSLRESHVHRSEMMQLLDAFPSSAGTESPSRLAAPTMHASTTRNFLIESRELNTTDSSTTSLIDSRDEITNNNSSTDAEKVLNLLGQFPLLSPPQESILAVPSSTVVAPPLPYSRAIETMKHLADLSSPRDKIACIARATSAIVECVQVYYASKLTSKSTQQNNDEPGVPSVYDCLSSILIFIYAF
jgi:hypothetical protein